MHWGVPQLLQRVVQSHQLHRIPAAAKAGKVVSDQLAFHAKLMGPEQCMNRLGEKVQLQRRRTAHPAYQEQDAIAGGKGQVMENRVYYQVDDFRHTSTDRTHFAGFAVYAYSHFD